MSSDRFQVQIEIEKIIGCSDPVQLGLQKAHFKKEISEILVSESQLGVLTLAAKLDASGTFFKALLSIVEAMQGLTRGGHSWAVVKLYYSAFYLLRFKMTARGHVFFKCAGTIYSVELKKNAIPTERSRGKFAGSEIRGDHKTVMATYINHLGANDNLLTNKVGDQSVFEWMMSAREDVHYRSPTFSEPVSGIFFNELFTEAGLMRWIKKYLNDPTTVHCFLAQHCCLATPLVLARTALNEHLVRFTEPPLTSLQGQFLLEKLDEVFQEETDFHKLVVSATVTFSDADVA
jgi:hypothetical protein